MFNEYKERNMKIISLYKLLIDNFYQINAIRNYNINNNIIINDDFDLCNSNDFFIKEKYECDDDECLSSKYNKLSSFYSNKNHIKTKQYSEYVITKKFCNKKTIKKCILIDNKKIVFIFENDKVIYSFYENNSLDNYKEYEIIKVRKDDIIEDIYPLKDNKFIVLYHINKVEILKIENKKFCSYPRINETEEFSNINYVFIDEYNRNNYFLIENNKNQLKIKYCCLTDTSFNKEFDFYLILLYNNMLNLKYLFNDIIGVISNSEIRDEDKKLLKKIFIGHDNYDNNLKSIILFKANEKLLNIIDERINKLYTMIESKIEKDDEKNKYIFNSHYIYYKIIMKLCNNNELDEKEINKINYFVKFYKTIESIKKIYNHYLILNSKLNNIYNFNNEKIIFMGEKYLFMTYRFKTKELSSLNTLNFLPDKDTNYNNYEITNIYNDYIILNNFEKKIIYIIINDSFYLIERKYNYYYNILVDHNYLIFDTIKGNDLQFKFIDLNYNLEEKNHSLKELFNFKIDNNIPKFLLSFQNNNFLTTYENNQISLINYKLLIDEKEKDNNKKQKIKEFTVIQTEKFYGIFSSECRNKKYKMKIIPKISDCSDIYTSSYHPKYLFTNDDYYYCSGSGSNHFIEFDFSQEYYFIGFKIIYSESYKHCKPKNNKIQTFDNKKRLTKELEFTCELNKNICLESFKEKARYIKFIFTENFGGEYIVIKKMEFYRYSITSLE